MSLYNYRRVQHNAEPFFFVGNSQLFYTEEGSF